MASFKDTNIQKRDTLEKELNKKLIIALVLLFLLFIGNIDGRHGLFGDISRDLFRDRDGGVVFSIFLIIAIISLSYRKIIGYFSHKTILKELNQFLEILKLTKDEEISELLLMATIAREDLINKKVIDENIFDNLNGLYVDTNKMNLRLAMTMYVNELSQNENNLAQSAGIKVWLVTLKSETNFNCMLTVKKIWLELDRGFKNLDKFIKDFENKNDIILSEWCKSNIHYRPKI